MNWLRLLILILADYRLARVISSDDISRQVRQAFGKRAAKLGEFSLAWYVAEWLNCPYCQGVWGAGLLALLAHPHDWREWLTWTLAIAGGQVILERRL